MFRSLDNLALDVKTALDATKAFKAVEVAAVTSYKGIIAYAGNIAIAPKAIVCIGSVEYGDWALTRTVTIGIAIFAAYRNSDSRREGAITTLAEAALQPFMPTRVEGHAPVIVAINNVQYLPESSMPLDTGDGPAGMILSLKATQITHET